MQHDSYRREVVSFDASYFEKQKQLGKSFSVSEVFNHIHAMNLWGSDESVSGEGSTAIETEILKQNLLQLFDEFSIKSIVDAGCGDFAWLGSMDLSLQYDGYDVIPHAIARLNDLYKDQDHIRFHLGNFLETYLPRADLILCRDCLVHLSFADIQKALLNFKRSGAKYLLTTDFTACENNEDIVTGDWRTLNFELAPFNFPKPISVLVEGCLQNDGLYQDKSLALWDLSKL